MVFGNKLANKVSGLLATWAFVFWFISFVSVWIFINIFLFKFDQYPFILLNLCLSCFSAFIAPIIMIAQKHQEAIQQRQTATLLHIAEGIREQLKIALEQQKQHLLDHPPE